MFRVIISAIFSIIKKLNMKISSDKLKNYKKYFDKNGLVIRDLISKKIFYQQEKI